MIDEIQRVPELLNEVHRLIEKKKITFLLTGSSARKLKKGHANLLAGRAWVAHLFPLTWFEIKNFNLERYLQYGGLPNVYLSKNPREELQAYTRTYLYEEIQAEAIVRKIPGFSRFLEASALSTGELLNFTEVGNDCHVSPSTVREYYSILEDTLMGFFLSPWTKSKKRKAIQTAKFYFFDVGVANHLAKIHFLDRHSNLYGRAFEHFIAGEIRAYLSYSRNFDALTFWRSVNKQEVDFIIGDHTAIEVKATQKLSPKHFRGLKALEEENVFKKYILISQDSVETKKGNMDCFHWENFLKQLWNGSFF